MKRRDLFRRIAGHAQRQGLSVEIVEGRRHTLVRVGEAVTTVPRHSEINEITARAILKQIGVGR